MLGMLAGDGDAGVTGVKVEASSVLAADMDAGDGDKQGVSRPTLPYPCPFLACLPACLPCLPRPPIPGAWPLGRAGRCRWGDSGRTHCATGQPHLHPRISLYLPRAAAAAESKEADAKPLPLAVLSEQQLQLLKMQLHTYGGPGGLLETQKRNVSQWLPVRYVPSSPLQAVDLARERSRLVVQRIAQARARPEQNPRPALRGAHS